MGLFGEDQPLKKPAEVVKDSGFQEAMAYYFAQHLERFGIKPMPPGGHGGRILKELLAGLGRDETLAIIREFIWSRDPRIMSGNYTLKDLQYHAPRLRLHVAGTNGAPDPRLAANAEAVERATRVKPKRS